MQCNQLSVKSYELSEYECEYVTIGYWIFVEFQALNGITVIDKFSMN